MSGGPTEAIAFGERILSLLEQGRFTATYKYAVLLALIDVCLESTDRAGRGSREIPVAALAEKTAQMYWRQTEPFASPDSSHEAAILKQNIQGQAEMVSLVAKFRERSLQGRSGSLPLARAKDPDGYSRLTQNLEWKLAQMPLPRLQLVGKTRAEFLYSLDWDERVTRSAYFSQSHSRSLKMAPRASDHLIRLSGLLRPLIQRDWASWIARQKFNRTLIQDAYLDDFLFGASRIPLAKIRAGLAEIQAEACFYCGRKARDGDVDHFIPWSRSGDNGIENLVLACRGCNNSKRDYLAAGRHVIRWSARFDTASPVHQELVDLAASAVWETDLQRTMSVARALYTRLPSDVLLWDSRDTVVPASSGYDSMRRALAQGSG